MACYQQIDADPDPDPAYHFDADADPNPDFQFDADPYLDPQHCLFLWYHYLVYEVKSAGSNYQILVGGALVPGYPAGQLYVRALGAAPPPARARQPPLHNEGAQRAEHVRRLEAGRSLVLRRQALPAVGAAGASAAAATA